MPPANNKENIYFLIPFPSPPRRKLSPGAGQPPKRRGCNIPAGERAQPPGDAIGARPGEALQSR